MAYEKKFDNGIAVSPFIRYSVSSKTENSNGVDTDHDGKVRYGLKMGYTADNGIGVYAETYYQNEPKENTPGPDSPDKNRVFFKLVLDYKF